MGGPSPAHVRYSLADDDDDDLGGYTARLTCFDVLSEDAIRWCGASNRHGGHCIIDQRVQPPRPDVFLTLRRLAMRHHHPVLLMYGVRCAEGEGLILFRPEDGTSRRVHFNVVELDNAVRVTPLLPEGGGSWGV